MKLTCECHQEHTDGICLTGDGRFGTIQIAWGHAQAHHASCNGLAAVLGVVGMRDVAIPSFGPVEPVGGLVDVLPAQHLIAPRSCGKGVEVFEHADLVASGLRTEDTPLNLLTFFIFNTKSWLR